MRNETEKCIQFLKEKYALDISMYDDTFVERGIKIRMETTSCKTIDDYLLRLDIISNEVEKFLEQLANSYSEFFRNPLTFAYLEQTVLPTLMGQKIKNNEKEIRIWSAACASGQEAYSLAILCDEIIKATNTNITFRIFATDINLTELANAQRGAFQSKCLCKVTLGRLQSYFTKRGEIYTIEPRLKDLVNFSIFDLLSENRGCPPSSIYGNFDLVFCSNLMFYYKPEYQFRIVQKISHCLAPDGFIITGESEREIVKGNNFREVFVNSAIFKKH